MRGHHFLLRESAVKQTFQRVFVLTLEIPGKPTCAE